MNLPRCGIEVNGEWTVVVHLLTHYEARNEYC